MPTYEYKCQDEACQHQWEEDGLIKDPPTEICPKCQKKTAKRQISAGTGFILQGGGWAADRYSTK